MHYKCTPIFLLTCMSLQLFSAAGSSSSSYSGMCFVGPGATVINPNFSNISMVGCDIRTLASQLSAASIAPERTVTKTILKECKEEQACDATYSFDEYQRLILTRRFGKLDKLSIDARLCKINIQGTDSDTLTLDMEHLSEDLPANVGLNVVFDGATTKIHPTHSTSAYLSLLSRVAVLNLMVPAHMAIDCNAIASDVAVENIQGEIKFIMNMSSLKGRNVCVERSLDVIGKFTPVDMDFAEIRDLRQDGIIKTCPGELKLTLPKSFTPAERAKPSTQATLKIGEHSITVSSSPEKFQCGYRD